MFATSPQGGSTPASVSVEWSCRDPVLDAWILEHLDPQQQAILGQFDLPTRTRTVTVVKEKHSVGLVRVPAPYLLKILMSAGRGPYAAGPAGPVMQGPPLNANWGSAVHDGRAPTAPRGVATPQQPQRAPTPMGSAASATPPWVRGAWAVHQQRAELIRYLSRTLPPQSLDGIASLSAVQQYVACVALLLSEQSYPDPAAFFRDWDRRVRRLPAISGPASSPMPSSSQVGKVALVHLGLSTGWEWMSALLAARKLADSGVQIALGDRIACPMHCTCPNELLEHLRNNDKGGQQPIHYVTVDDLLPQIEGYVGQWHSAQVPVIVCMVLPAATAGAMESMVGPGFHDEGISDFWIYAKAAKIIAARVPHTTLCIMTPACMPVPSETFLTQVLGSAMTMHMNEVRVPQSPWNLRLTPPATRAPRMVRTVDASTCIEGLDPALLRAWDASATYQAELPNLRTLETYLDSVADGVEVGEALLQQVAAAHRAAPDLGSGVRTLLRRSDLINVFGMDKVPWSQFYDAVHPCVQWINKSTGLPSHQGMSEAVLCGSGRYCTACGSLYEALVEMPSFYALEEAWALSLGTQFPPVDGAVRSADVARLPEHDCRVMCGM